MSSYTWEEAMGWWAGLEPAYQSMVRLAAVQQIVASGAEDCGSSDVNHQVYAMYHNFLSYKKYCEVHGITEDIVEFINEEVLCQ
jgi:hypothetical protein